MAAWGKGPYPSLLFIAHREEILRQSRRTFRHVLNRGDFGELLVDGERPEATGMSSPSIQSLSPARLAAMPYRTPTTLSSWTSSITRKQPRTSGCSSMSARRCCWDDRDPRTHRWHGRPRRV